ncbi:beta-propeller domain-containing protein [Blautia sp. MSJ-19]|uniref:beta-propeller domain-containing protein n=1 Tax=Blautia sp. MSJ-19 TaxID=2841517 RepID=UPI001C0EAE3C|nr:beta-propeller domain-containing protein [Blautia sp. MSJ-19]MBU5482464.1 beta-propeller domain-containing protein [Blautia sp. MSJ-19]
MKGRYVLTAIAVLAVGAAALGTVTMWKGTDTTSRKETETVTFEDPVEKSDEKEIQKKTEKDTGKITATPSPEPLPTTAPIDGISHAGSYEELYDAVKDWQQNSSYSNMSPRIMAVEETADSTGSGAGDTASENMVASRTEEAIDPDFSYDGSQENVDHSTTNTQEKNVDEADIVKTDGTYIYAMDSRGNIRIADTSSMELIGEIAGDSSSDYREMYVDGDCLQVIREQVTYVTYRGKMTLPSADEAEDDEGTAVRTSYSIPMTTVTVETYDLADRTAPQKTGAYQQDGSYLSSRRKNGQIYLFTSYMPDTANGAEQLQYYVPRSGEEYISYDHIYLPEPGADFSCRSSSYLVAGAVSPDHPDQASDIMAVVSGAETFYVSDRNIYSAMSIWNDTETRTEIIRIGYEDGRFTDGAAGSVKGELNNNFSMDEYDGNLRVVTTTESWDKDYTELSRNNGLYVLDDTLRTIGKIEDLASGEELKSARFLGKTGYFVTYRNTDPLFAADLSDPENPRILSELKITGFSEYLHFYGENQLLGIGWETDPDTGNVDGMKCSMFDLTDPTDIQETDRFILKNVLVCDALSNYRAILASPQKNLFGFAYVVYGNSSDIYDTSENYYYALFSYSEADGFEPQVYLDLNKSELFDGSMDYQTYRTVRGVYAGNMFYLVTEKGIASYNMQDGYSLEKTLKWEE